MNATSLAAKVSAIIQDSGYTQAEILELLNAGVLQVASGGDGRVGTNLLAPLPELFTSDTVTVLADGNSVSMPDDYHRGLVMVVDSSGDELKLYEEFSKFLKRYPGLSDTGTIEACSLKGSTLYCQPSPSSNETLTVYYHRLPDDMVIATGPPAVDDAPDGLPAHLHEKLLVHYACREIYAEKEDGMDGSKANTAYHDAEYQKALSMLSVFIGPEDKAAQNVDDSNDDYVYP